MTFSKMMEAGKRRKEGIKKALVIKINEKRRGKAIIRQSELSYKEAVHQATLRYQREISNGGKKH